MSPLSPSFRENSLEKPSLSSGMEARNSGVRVSLRKLLISCLNLYCSGVKLKSITPPF